MRRYNYSFVRDHLCDKYQLKVSVPTIIHRTRENDFYMPGTKHRKTHGRIVLTDYAGELIQRGSSHHKWTPHSGKKWHLATSLDDHSLFLLHAELREKDTLCNNILGAKGLIMSYGCPHRYYVDSHSIFRFVSGRDSSWHDHRKVADADVPQWKQVLNDCNIEVIHSLSPQAHGKIERPYGWLQDRLVRICSRENLRDIESCREILSKEFNRYNNSQVHCTTGEISWVRFNRSLTANQSMFREVHVSPPYKLTKDIFCVKDERVADKYSEISCRNTRFKLPVSATGKKVNLRMVQDAEPGMTEVRFCFEKELLDIQKVKNEYIKSLHL